MKNDLFEKAKQAVAEKHGYPSWGSVVQNLVGDAYVTTLDHIKRDRKIFLQMEQEAAELYSQWIANDAVKADRSDAKNISFWSREENAGILILSVLQNRPLPFPQQPDGI